MKSFVANDGSSEPPSPGRNGERHFHREQRSNQTHGSITDPGSKLAKKGKGKEAKLAYTGNVMTESRNGFVVESELRQVSGAVERETAKDMIVRYSPGAKQASFNLARFRAVSPHVIRRHGLATRAHTDAPVTTTTQRVPSSPACHQARHPQCRRCANSRVVVRRW